MSFVVCCNRRATVAGDPFRKELVSLKRMSRRRLVELERSLRFDLGVVAIFKHESANDWLLSSGCRHGIVVAGTLLGLFN